MVLILIPLFAYFEFTVIIAALDSRIARLSMPIFRILIISTVILYLGLFPRFGKHLWSSITKKKIEWLNSAVNIEQLPHKIYSLQAIIILGVIPLVIMVLIMINLDTANNSINRQLLPKLYMSLYVSQFFVLLPLSKKRNYYKHCPKWLLSKRMIITYTVTIFIPVAFVIAVSPLVQKLESRLQPFSLALLLVYLLFFALPFPYYCNQSLLIVTRKRTWCKIKECPEIYEAKPPFWFWRYCIILACLCLIIYTFLYLFGVIDYDLLWDQIHQLGN